MGTVRATPAYMSSMAGDIGVGTPFYASTVGGDFVPTDSAPFYVSGWSGKTNYTPMSPVASAAGGATQSGAPSSNTFTMSVNENGGTAPYTYSWAATSVYGGTCAFSGGSTSKSVGYTVAPSTAFVPGGATLTCTVTDAASNHVASNSVTLQYTSP